MQQLLRKCLASRCCATPRYQHVSSRRPQPAFTTTTTSSFSVDCNNLRHHQRRRLLAPSNQAACKRTISFPAPPPLDITKKDEGPIQIADPALGEPATKITFVGEDHIQQDRRIFIKKINSVGFRLGNGMFAVGPIAIFPRFVLQWKVGRVDKLTPAAFIPFFLIEPKIDFLLVGYGDPEEHIAMELRQELMKRRRFGLDFMPTEKAVGVWNFMVEENRYCAGLFIPPIKVTYGDNDLFIEGHKNMDISRPSDDWTAQSTMI